MTTTAIIKLSDEANKVVNIIKAKYGFNDKSEALNYLIEEYEQELLEPALRPEYVEKIRCIEHKGKFVKIKSIEDLWK
ncbi:MAG: antitoxin [Candidatus Diapherotrites archaeon CG08_land_8_20_14_0_20_34_12]|nr:MAG: antitoxin [Candidatus Diapherotrites archaeon CG08_land_8_20_14_0_20_34_12]